VALLALSACGPANSPASEGDGRKVKAAALPKGSLAWAVAGDWRSGPDRARDRWRHPEQTLAFWGLKPTMTVVEFWPGAGWYTDILGPFLTQTGGKLYAVGIEASTQDSALVAIAQQFSAKLKATPRLYRSVTVTSFGAASGPVAPAASADMALFLRNLHNWMSAGIAEKAFAAAFAALKPGGVLGIEEHRAKPDQVQDVLASDGYVQEAYVRQLAKEAGFIFEEASEINANPKDLGDHPFGVWTLPPVRLSAPRGQAPDPKFDHAPYDAIGESDRMTLRFRKPKEPR
jgi:predicted methyltransferase